MTNKKIFLCFVNSSEDKGYHNFTIGGCSEHLGLGYLSSFLKENHYRSKIFIIDTLIQKHNLLKEIKEKEPLLVGFSIVNKNLNASIDLAKTIKAIAPGCHITFGGHLATLAGESILSDCSFVDSIVKGYGEETLLCLAKHLINKKNLFSIRGLLFRSKTKLINNLPRKVTRNIDRYPLPDRSYLKEHIIKGDFPSARLVSSRGCYYRCKYCSTPPFLDNQKCNKRWIPRSPQNVVAEIEYLKKKYDIKVIV
ncbi:MAG TPA: cobalamin-dependent protein, partial [Candidatus Lokiarchaeia archaeon]